MGLLGKANELSQNPQKRSGLLKSSLKYIGTNEVVPETTIQVSDDFGDSSPVFDEPEASLSLLDEYEVPETTIIESDDFGDTKLELDEAEAMDSFADDLEDTTLELDESDAMDSFADDLEDITLELDESETIESFEDDLEDTSLELDESDAMDSFTDDLEDTTLELDESETIESFEDDLEDITLELDESANMQLLIEDYRTNIGSIESEIDLVSYVTAIFIKYLKLKRIAWLMFDPVYDRYAPWIAVGFDSATKEKMFFPGDFMNKALKNPSITEFTGDTLDDFEAFFAENDFRSIETLHCLPLFYKKQLISFVLMINLQNHFTADQNFNARFSGIPSNLLESRYSKISEVLKYNKQNLNELNDDLTMQLEYAMQNKTVFNILKLSLEKTIQPLIEEDPKLNPLLLKEDVLLLLVQLFKHIGCVYNVKNSTLLFTLNKLRKLDIAVLRDQLLKTMKSYFTEIIKTNNFDLDFQVFSYPEDGETVASLLSNIL